MSKTDITADGTSKFLDLDHVRLHYNEAGEGHPVIMLHGSGPGATGWSNFQPNIGPLSENFRAMAFDMPGWGATEETGQVDERDHVATLLAALDALGIERASLVGNSMGGMTSIRFAVEHPDRISHLIAMGAPAPGANLFTPGGGMSEGLKILMETYADPSPANFKRMVSVMAFDEKYATDQLADERSRNALADPEKLESFGTTMRRSGPVFFGLANRLAEITAPTLIVHGRDDRTVSVENGLRLLASIPNSRALLFNRCGHWAQLEHAEEFNRVVTGFISNH